MREREAYFGMSDALTPEVDGLEGVIKGAIRDGISIEHFIADAKELWVLLLMEEIERVRRVPCPRR
jgi:hypothetical protein